MSASNFTVRTHRVQGQHIREYAAATRYNEEDVLYLEAKQYIPKSNPDPKPGDVTILATHAMSFPKELYEPLWEDILLSGARHGLRIRSIWIADCSNQGSSGVINEAVQGDEPSFFDYPRDMLHMINTFRHEFPQPIVGVGHSMGGTALVQLAFLHPRLLAGLVLFDPVIGINAGVEFATMFFSSSIRPDLWATREEAESHSKAIFRTWDQRVFDRWLKHGFRETPTLLHSEAGKTTLKTTKAQESWTCGRSWFEPLPEDGTLSNPLTRAKYPDQNDSVRSMHPFFRAEDLNVWNDLPRLRPGVLFVFPSTGPMTSIEALKAKVERTGTGVGGSGGVKEGRVSQVVIPDTGHLLPFEQPAKCAAAAAEWIAKDVAAWSARREYAAKNRDDISIDQLALSKEWIKQAKVFYQRIKRRERAKL